MWFIIIFLIIAILGLLCNGSILYSVIKHRVLRQKPYALLVSLAVCDLFKVIVLINITIYSTRNDLFDMCVITSSLGMTLIGITTFHLAAESLNRCLIILFPYQLLKILKIRYVAIVIVTLWILPIILSIVLPYVLFQKEMTSSLDFQAHMFGCIEDRILRTFVNNATNYTYIETLMKPIQSGTDEQLNMTHHIVYFAIPLFTMVICYSIMLNTAYKSAKNMRGLHVDQTTSNSAIVSESTYSVGVIKLVKNSVASSIVPPTIELPGYIEHKRRTQSAATKAAKELRRLIKDRKREIKASKTALIIITAFIVCNAPIFAVTWVDHEKHLIGRLLRQVLVAIAFLQVFIDPVVYFARLRDFKNARKKCKRVGTTLVRKVTLIRKSTKRFQENERN